MSNKIQSLKKKASIDYKNHFLNELAEIVQAYSLHYFALSKREYF